MGARPLSQRLSPVQRRQNPNHNQLARLVSGLEPGAGPEPRLGSSTQAASAVQQSTGLCLGDTP